MSFEFECSGCFAAPAFCTCPADEPARCHECGEALPDGEGVAFEGQTVCRPCHDDLRRMDEEWAAREQAAVEQGRREMEAS